MVKLNGWEETTLSVLILAKHLLLIGLLNAMMVEFFLSGINLSIFLHLNPAIYKIANAPSILCPRCKERDRPYPNRLPSFYLLLKDLAIIMRVSVQTHESIHLKTLHTLLQVFLRYLSYCRSKAFNEVWDEINKFSNFKFNIFSRLNKLQDTATELDSNKTFLRTWNSLLNYTGSLNEQFTSFLSAMPQSNS